MAELARKHIDNLIPYQSARRIGGTGEVWLNANELPFANSYNISSKNLNRYPEPQPASLLKTYSEYSNVAEENILVTRGADEGIDLLVQAFCEPGVDSVLYSPPTYGMYKVSAKSHNVGCVEVPLFQDWDLDISSIKSSLDNIKMVFVCRPNNPTGSLISKAAVKTLLDDVNERALVVVDEAYIDFCIADSIVDLLDEYENLVILRTLSKAFGLAGIRCGFVLANQKVLNVLSKIIAPYPIAVPVSEIAESALSESGLAQMQTQIAEVSDNKARLIKELNKIDGVKVSESAANFILVKSNNADEVFKLAGESGIVLRQVPVENCLRVTVGTTEECSKIIKLYSEGN